jgi:RNA polymerase sigma-70 factor (ECF subfamily)
MRARRNEESGQVSADRSLVTNIARGDSTALAELYDTHGTMVYTLALRIVKTPGDAEEVVQEVFAQAWRQAARYDAARATVAGWLSMMTRARALDALRAKAARPDASRPVEMPELPAQTTSQEAALITGEAVERVRDALNSLDETFRLPIELAYYGGLSQSEIATKLQEPLGTIKTRMRTALSRLRDALSREEAR